MFTPALPDISKFFSLNSNQGAYTITSFLLGYAIGQLIYGPIANRYGRKPALYAGIVLQILSSFLCILAGPLHSFTLLVVARFFVALGSGVGLKMTFTIINETYQPKEASQKIAYLMLAFAITPGLGTLVGGMLNTHFGWMSCFVAGMVYGLMMLILVTRLPETVKTLDYFAFNYKHLMEAYSQQFKNSQLVMGGFIMGCCTSFTYLFAAIAPYVAIQLYSLNSSQYGVANILPTIGIILGSFLSANLVGRGTSLRKTMFMGMLISLVGLLLFWLGLAKGHTAMFAIFVPMIVINLGLCCIFANVSTLAMLEVQDKAQGSAVMNFLNKSTTTIVVILMGYVLLSKWELLISYSILWLLIVLLSSIKPKSKVADRN